jgi:hypothetical protein
MTPKRIVCWFSCGAASAVATKLTIEANAKAENTLPLVVARIRLVNEDEDNDRFAADCEKWFGVPILNLMREEYEGDVYKVIEKFRYVSGPKGAPCTRELKKRVREAFQRHDDLHVFGYTAEEQGRVDLLLDANADLRLWSILIDKWLDKKDCLAIVDRAGIKLPEQYKRGFDHNNCKACVKATSPGYWNLVRIHHPAEFERMAKVSEALGSRMVRVKGVRKFLRELLPTDGNIKEQETIECGVFCELAEKEISA